MDGPEFDVGGEAAGLEVVDAVGVALVAAPVEVGVYPGVGAVLEVVGGEVVDPGAPVEGVGAACEVGWDPPVCHGAADPLGAATTGLTPAPVECVVVLAVPAACEVVGMGPAALASGVTPSRYERPHERTFST